MDVEILVEYYKKKVSVVDETYEEASVKFQRRSNEYFSCFHFMFCVKNAFFNKGVKSD